MQYEDVVQGRRSIRGYKPEPVPKALIREVLALAMRAPTSLNTQPWNFYVVTGEALDRIRAGNVERNLAGVPDTREFRRHTDTLRTWMRKNATTADVYLLLAFLEFQHGNFDRAHAALRPLEARGVRDDVVATLLEISKP